MFFTLTPTGVWLITSSGAISFPLSLKEYLRFSILSPQPLEWQGGSRVPIPLVYLRGGKGGRHSLGNACYETLKNRLGGAAIPAELRAYGNGLELEVNFKGKEGEPKELLVALSSGIPERVDRKGNLTIRGDGWQILLPPPQAYRKRDELALPVQYQIRGREYAAVVPTPPSEPWALVLPFLPPSSTPQSYPRAFTWESRGDILLLLDFPYGMQGDTDLLLLRFPTVQPALRSIAIVGGSHEDNGSDLALDSQGNTVLVGKTISGDFPITSNRFDGDCGALRNTTGLPPACFKSEGFLVRISPKGDLLYGTLIGGEEDDLLSGVAIRGDRIVVVGSTHSPDLPGRGKGYDSRCGNDGLCSQTEGNPAMDAFVALFTLEGKHLVTTYLGGGGEDLGMSVALDPLGNIVVAGSTLSADFPITPGAEDTTCGSDGRCDDGKSDGFLTKLNPEGTKLLYSTFVGEEREDAVARVELITTGKILLTGLTRSQEFPRQGIRQARGVQDWNLFKIALLPRYTLEVRVDGPGSISSNPTGIACGSQCSYSFPEGSVVELIPLKGRGARFLGFTGDPECSKGKVRMRAAVHCEAKFKGSERTLTVKIQGDGNGSVESIPEGLSCPPRCTLTLGEGSLVTLLPKPSSGSSFVTFSGDPDCSDGRIILDGDRHCIIHFQQP